MLLITSDADVQQALAFIEQNDILSYDVESTGLNVRKDRIIGFGVSNRDDGFYLPIFVYDAASAALVRTDVPDSAVQAILALLLTKKLVMHNASYDCRITLCNLGVDLVPALYADSMLAKHTVEEMPPFSLKDIAANLFGLDAKAEQLAMKESIKRKGGSTNDFYKADLQLMAEYCVADCKLTMRVFEHYLRLIRQQGLEDFFFNAEVMPLYRTVTIPMERTGFAVDVPGLQRALNEICEDIETLESEVQNAISPYVQMLVMQKLDKQFPMLTAKTLKPTAWRKKFDTQLEAWADANDGESLFNLQSKHDLVALFFGPLGLEPLNKTPTGRPQVDEEFLDSVAPKFEWAAKLVQFNKLNKLKSTYIETLLEEQDGGIFYPSYKQHGSVSGRYSGNTQQLPRPIPGADSDVVARHTSSIRSFVTARDGNLLISCDYESLEPHIFAHTSGDTALQEIFNSGHDFYSTVAIRTEKLEGVSADKNAPNFLGKVNKAARQKAKVYALGLAYGMGAWKLQFELGTDRLTAENLVNDYLAAFPQLAAWMTASKQEVLRTGQIASQAGRIRHMPQAVRLYRQYGNDVLDDLALWKRFSGQEAAYKKAKEDRKTLKNLLNNSINFQVQSLAASIVSRASIEINRRLLASGSGAKLVLSLHDEVLLDCPKSEVDKVGAMVKDVMENIVTLAVPLHTEPQSGRTFKDCK